MSRLFYLASPYSHPQKEVMQLRFEQVTEAAVGLIKYGVFAFAPISYNHPMVKYNLPTNWEFWKIYDIAFLDRCGELIVLMLDGWDTSVGVTAEIEHAKSMGYNIIYLSLSDIHNEAKIKILFNL